MCESALSKEQISFQVVTEMHISLLLRNALYQQLARLAYLLRSI